MNKPTRLTTADRNRATDRVRTLTAGTALASFAAVGLFGVAAAATNPGKTTDSSVAISADSATIQTTDTSDQTSTSADAGGSSTSQAAATSTPTLQATAAPVTTTHKAHVTSGGS
jgi:hypothetical protein